MKKKIIYAIIAIVVIVSVAFNVYWFYGKTVQKIEQRGVNLAVFNVLKQLKDNGQVVINTEEGQIILVEKVNSIQSLIEE